jgi:hypothetical protein
MESTDANEAQHILIDHMQTINKQSQATGWIDKIPANQFSAFIGEKFNSFIRKVVITMRILSNGNSSILNLL